METKRILENIDENGALYTQLYAVFKTFSGAIKLDEDDDDMEIMQN